MDRNFFPYDFTTSLFSQNLIPSPYYPVPPTGALAATIQAPATSIPAPTQETSTESAVESHSRQKSSLVICGDTTFKSSRNVSFRT